MNKYYQDIITQIETLAPILMPEWKFNEHDFTDSGSALAVIFAHFTSISREKFMEMSTRHKIAFYNLLGATALPARPSTGYVCFTVAQSDSKGTFIPKGFKLYSPPIGDNGNRIPFVTIEDVFVTGSKISEMTYSNYYNDVMCVGDSESLLSTADAHKPKRGFAFTHKYLNRNLRLYIHCDCSIDLCDITKVKWSCSDGEIFLVNEEKERGNRFLLCGIPEKVDYINAEILDVIAFEQYAINELLISAEGENIVPDDIITNGEFQLDESFYPFGNSEETECYNEFDEMHIICDDILSLGGSLITLTFGIDFEVVEIEEVVAATEPPSKKFIIMKKDIPKPQMSDIVIENVVWEYYNGYGYVPLPLKTLKNNATTIFADIENTACKLEFICPPDIQPILVGAKEGYCIKLRIRKVRNLYKRPAKMYVPKIHNVRLACKTPKCDINCGEWENLGIKHHFEHISQLQFCRTLPKQPKASVLIFNFDKPVTNITRIMFTCKRQSVENSNLIREWQYYCNSSRKWYTLKVSDSTNGFIQDGVVAFVLDSEALQIRCIFEGIPNFTIKDIRMNAVRIVQHEIIANETYYVDKNGIAKLKHDNIISEKIRIIEVDGTETLLVENIHYLIDRVYGTVAFSNDVRKNDGFSIKVDCCCTDGQLGNISANSNFVPSLSVGYINGAVNPYVISGGRDCENESQSSKRIGKNIRHSGRCVTATDYYDMINACDIGDITAITCVNVSGGVEIAILFKDYHSPNAFDEARHNLLQMLTPHIPLGVGTVVIRPPDFVRVNIKAEIAIIEKEAEDEVYAVLAKVCDPVSCAELYGFGRLPNEIILREELCGIVGVSRCTQLFVDCESGVYSRYSLPIKGRFEIKFIR